MNCFRNSKKHLDDINNYTSAGCIFTDNTLILAGYQPYKKTPFISGIGGKKQKEETYAKTAMRELTEELLNIYDLSPNIYQDLYSIKPLHIQYANGYVNCIFNFDQLGQILEIVSLYNVESNLYTTFPKNITDLIFTRTINNNEISHLCLLPVINTNIQIDKDFNNDIITLYNTMT
jgi:hypothetical protein